MKTLSVQLLCAEGEDTQHDIKIQMKKRRKIKMNYTLILNIVFSSTKSQCLLCTSFGFACIVLTLNHPTTSEKSLFPGGQHL